MKSGQFHPRLSPRTHWHVFARRKPPLVPAQRQRQFLQALPLVLLPALFALPAWLLLVHQKRFPNSDLLAAVLLPAFLVMAIVGTQKMARCIDWKTLDLIGAMAFAAFLVLGVMALYAIVFFVAYFQGSLP